MLILNNISKIYTNDTTQTIALENINLSIGSTGLVVIFGPSGCGKTTLLNIIGGLDQYTRLTSSGTAIPFVNYRKSDVIINHKSTYWFEETDWDHYRNERVGFIFQNYNLIPQISILDNVELGLALSGMEKETRRSKAMIMLEKVGMHQYADKNSAQLSSGQKQRVAVARALANNPDIILADEPIGALDSESGKEVMLLLKEISKEKLVIMATHNEPLSLEYANRVIRLIDGRIISDDAISEHEDIDVSAMATDKTIMPWRTALNLSFKNLVAKMTRTIIAIIAGSIGIAGIATVLAIANGFGLQIERMEEEALSTMPIAVYRNPSKDSDFPLIYGTNFTYNESGWFAPTEPGTSYRTNNITENYLAYLDEMNPLWTSGVSYRYGVRVPFLVKHEDTLLASFEQPFDFQPLHNSTPYLKSQYTLQAGRFPESYTDIVLLVDAMNQIDSAILSFLNVSQDIAIGFEAVLGKEIVLVHNNDLNPVFNPVTNTLERSYDNTTYENGILLTVVGVLKGKPDSLETHTSGIFYSDTLEGIFVKENYNSDFCVELREIDLFETPLEERPNHVFQRRSNGCQALPLAIQIFPTSIHYKETLLHYLDEYNQTVSEREQIIYTDHAAVLSSILGSISNNVMLVLFALGTISLLVSLMMISILIYVGLLERTKEIGILRSLGASKKDIAKVLNTETALIGLFAGIFGILVTLIMSFPLNLLLRGALIGLEDVVKPRLIHGIILIVVTVMVTYASGYIPARIAARKHPAEALKYEG